MMSEKTSLESGLIDKIFDREIKGKVDTPWRFQIQMARCNQLMSGPDQIAFEASVRALLGDLPLHIKNIVVGRKDEFNSTPPSTYQFKTTCGVNIGTIKNPFVSVPGHPEYDFWLDIPKPYRETHDDEISIISPVEVPGELYTDHEKLLELIKEEADRGGIGWKYQRAAKEMGPVEKVLPGKLAGKIEKVLVNMMIEHRREGIMYSWAELIGSQRDRTPRTPTPPVDPPKER